MGYVLALYLLLKTGEAFLFGHVGQGDVAQVFETKAACEAEREKRLPAVKAAVSKEPSIEDFRLLCEIAP